ncbi:MAG: hypothetical protein E7317_10360 [Clostridiales bacterium]|nr:hypothetical protein [Clostridiales bacterium]
MHYDNRRPRRRRRGGNNARIILILAVVLAAEVIALCVILPRLNDRQSAPQPTAMVFDRSLATLPPVTEAPVITALPTQAPALETAYVTQPPAVQQAEADAVNATFPPVVEAAPQQASAGGASLTYLPVFEQAETQEKVIAVTVDDCFQVNNLKKIVGYAENAGAKLTLFPIGKNLSKDGMQDIFRHAVFDLGFEVENHTFNHARVFRMPQQEMAREIWDQSQAVSRLLGVNYEQHFFRMMGGDGDTDQRVHNYIDQLGFKGIAHWAVSGSDSDLKKIRSSLAPGKVYLFHTTDGDTDKLKSFIPYAVEQGYRLVTMNELFGYPDNATSELTEQAMPEPRPFEYDWRTIVKGEYTWVTVKLQDALRAQGLLKIDGESTGFYGKQTVQAVTDFQRAHGLPATGEADRATQEAILGGVIDLG